MAIELTIHEKLTILRRLDYVTFFGVSLVTAGEMLNEDKQQFETRRLTVSMFQKKYCLNDDDLISLFPYKKNNKV